MYVASRDPMRPNLIVIMTDDQGPWALGAAGNHEIVTPNLDDLAERGLRLDRFFCASPVCSPARASLYTGEIPSGHGVHDWLSGGHVGDDRIDYLAGKTLLTDVLADAGYRCGLSGKWHLGANDQPRKGFVRWFAHQTGGGPYYGAPVVRDGELTTQNGYLTYAITDEARDFIESETANDDPFFLAVHYTAPHAPWIGNHPSELTALYQDCEFDTCPQPPLHPWARVRDGMLTEAEADLHAALTGYFASITGVDRGVGDLLETLRRHELDEHTLVVFTSDNGFNCGHHGFWGKGNGTYPQNMYDESVLVPAIFHQPGRVPGGRVSSDLLSAYDVFCTLLEYVGVPYEPNVKSPGASFAGLLTDDPSWHGADRIVVHDEYGPVRMIRTQEWKYVRRAPGGPDELYDLVDDPGEETNLVADATHADRLARMSTQLDQWYDRYGDPQHDGRDLPVTGWGQRKRDSDHDAFERVPD